MHAVMQYVHYDCCSDAEEIRKEIDRLTKEHYITQSQADMVDTAQIAAFFGTELGKKLQNHPNVLREFKFSILEDATNFDPQLAGEKILLQGVVDCAMVDEDGITVIDFKTDFVTEETLDEKTELYRPQVTAYAEAISRIYEIPVKSSWLYFFQLGKFVEI